MIDNQTFLKDVYTQLEFMMKRNGSLLGVVALVISHLNSVEYNKDIVHALSDNLISSDFLVNAEY